MDKSIVDQLGYNNEEKKSIQSLWRDESCRLDVKKALGSKLAGSDSLIIGNSLNQLCLIMCQADFADTEDETITVAVIVLYCLKVPDILPSLAEHRGRAFAARSLVALGMFNKAMEERCQRRGAPKPDYYRQIGKLYFKQDNLPEIANHFKLWENFLAERFV